MFTIKLYKADLSLWVVEGADSFTVEPRVGLGYDIVLYRPKAIRLVFAVREATDLTCDFPQFGRAVIENAHGNLVVELSGRPIKFGAGTPAATP